MKDLLPLLEQVARLGRPLLIIAKVVRSALQNASSMASLLLTTKRSSARFRKRKKAAPMPGGGGMGGMY